jgi:hypothetical protein
VKKLVCFALLLCAVFLFVFGEDIVCEVTAETPLLSDSFGTNYARRILEKGEKVYFLGDVEPQGNSVFRILVLTGQNEKGWVDADDVLLSESDALPEYIISKMWIYSFYQDILVERNREVLFKYETFWRDDYKKALQRELPTSWDTYWWEHFYPTYFYLHNNLVYINNLFWDDHISFASTQQYHNGDTTILKVVCTAKRGDFPENPINKLFEKGNKYTIEAVPKPLKG